MRSQLANSRFTFRPSVRELVVRKGLTFALLALIALLVAGFPTLRRAQFLKRVNAQESITPQAVVFTVNTAADPGTFVNCTLRGQTYRAS